MSSLMRMQTLEEAALVCWSILLCRLRMMQLNSVAAVLTVLPVHGSGDLSSSNGVYILCLCFIYALYRRFFYHLCASFSSQFILLKCYFRIKCAYVTLIQTIAVALVFLVFWITLGLNSFYPYILMTQCPYDCYSTHQYNVAQGQLQSDVPPYIAALFQGGLRCHRIEI